MRFIFCSMSKYTYNNYRNTKFFSISSVLVILNIWLFQIYIHQIWICGFHIIEASGSQYWIASHHFNFQQSGSIRTPSERGRRNHIQQDNSGNWCNVEEVSGIAISEYFALDISRFQQSAARKCRNSPRKSEHFSDAILLSRFVDFQSPSARSGSCFFCLRCCTPIIVTCSLQKNAIQYIFHKALSYKA